MSIRRQVRIHPRNQLRPLRPLIRITHIAGIRYAEWVSCARVINPAETPVIEGHVAPRVRRSNSRKLKNPTQVQNVCRVEVRSRILQPQVVRLRHVRRIRCSIAGDINRPRIGIDIYVFNFFEARCE